MDNSLSRKEEADAEQKRADDEYKPKFDDDDDEDDVEEHDDDEDEVDEPEPEPEPALSLRRRLYVAERRRLIPNPLNYNKK